MFLSARGPDKSVFCGYGKSFGGKIAGKGRRYSVAAQDPQEGPDQSGVLRARPLARKNPKAQSPRNVAHFLMEYPSAIPPRIPEN